MTLALLLLALQASSPQGEPPAEAPLEWNQHLGAALRQAIQRKTGIVLLFSTKSCGWCRKLQEETFRDPKVKAALARRVLVHLDLEDESEIAQALGAQAVPDVRLYTAEGLPLAQQTGFLSAEPFLQWLETGAAGKPLPKEPSLRALRLDTTLDEYFDLEAKGKPLPGEKLPALLLLAAGSSGESRTEALRLVRKWAPAAPAELVQALGHRKLKVRLAAYDALVDLGAPLGKLDPWAGPAAELPALESWLKERPVAAAGAKAPVPPAAAWTSGLEADLLLLEGEGDVHSSAARERLISGGIGLIPRLRDRGRTLRGAAPKAAERLDEIRFRILLTPAVLRSLPDASSRLAVGTPGERSRSLGEVLKRHPVGLEGLVREAVCDPDALFRETAAASTRAILGPGAREVLAELLKDPEANVRAAALREMASIPTKGTAEAIRDYLTREKDPDMVGHAVRSLQEVPTATSREVLRSLLQSPYWSVRGAAIKALMELKDIDSLPEILDHLKDPDEFVVGQALVAISKLLDQSSTDAGAAGLADRIGELMEARPQLVRAAIKTLSHHRLRGLKKTDSILRQCSHHADAGVRAAAIAALAADQERPAFEEVRAAMEDKDVQVRSAALQGLRALVDTKVVFRMLGQSLVPDGYPDCRSVILGGLQDPDPGIRLESALTLLYFGDLEGGRQVWRPFLRDPDPGLRERAFEGFRWIGPKEFLKETVTDLWKGASAEDRESILDHLQHSERHVESFGLLLELLPRIQEGELRSWSDALVRGSLGDEFDRSPEAVAKRKAFARALTETRAGDLSEGQRILLTVLGQSFEPTVSEEDLKAQLKSPHALLRRSALAGLLRAEASLNAEELEPLLRDPEPKVRALGLLACFPSSDRRLFDDLNHDWLGGKTVRYWYQLSYSSGTKKLVQLPEALLNERLGDVDADVRLRAAALMTLEGSDEALAYLHRAWREDPAVHTRDLLIRGVVGAWEDAYTSILEEILETIPASESYTFTDLYHRIQPLKGPLIRAFRKRLVEEYHVQD